MAIRFDESNVRSMGRSAAGVRGIDLGESDNVVGALPSIVKKQTVTMCATNRDHNGYGKQPC